MKRQGLKRSIQFKLAFIGLLMLVQPAFCGDLSESGEAVLKGKVFGDQLIMIDEGGRQTISKDGIYTAQDGMKITVKGGEITEVPTTAGKGMYSIFRIVEVEYFDTE